ncbi:ribosomal RNA methyltransferase FtsJ domain-containing protein [Gymnopilus junonius]|uniref:rRNA methyltransferase 2, mitochondrial n=1 Tax=Gymnopilus junonius TaxID=109634 RepID=A0A9P5NHN0_GYMJU|nr:ribosomal RNA methyltransferase FtsJ domain-containing protein [Gymnopilus junonius]
MAFRQTAALLSQKSKSKSASWAARQFRDPYVKKRLSDPAAYRARSAFKLLEINDEVNGFIDYPDVNAVVDLGAAPGGWSQVVAGRLGWGERKKVTPSPPPQLWDRNDEVEEEAPADFSVPGYQEKKAKRKSSKRSRVVEAELTHFDPLNIDDADFLTSNAHIGRGTILAVDLLKVEPIPGVKAIQADFLLPSTTRLLTSLLRNAQNPEGKADVILSDMAGNVSGNDAHDIHSSLEICEKVFEFAREHLRSAESIGRKRGGVLLMKFFTHPLLEQFRDEVLNPNFHHVYYIKPDSSRPASKEGYYLCQGWKPF